MIDELTPAQRWKSYLDSRRTYDAVLDAWHKGGALGPPPPEPIPPAGCQPLDQERNDAAQQTP